MAIALPPLLPLPPLWFLWPFLPLYPFGAILRYSVPFYGVKQALSVFGIRYSVGGVSRATVVVVVVVVLAF